MQRLALTLLSLVVFATAARETKEKRIVGGGPSEHHAHPYIASLRLNSGIHQCGGSIISERWILTAAHCVCDKIINNIPLKPDDIYVVVGANSRHGHGPPNKYEQTIKVTAFICHKNYIYTKLDPDARNDIAVLKLASPIKTNKNVKIAKMATEDSPFINTDCVISGWGRKHWSHGSGAKHLQEVEIPMISNDDCKKRWRDASNTIYPSQTCVFDIHNLTSACSGDSGGPMMCGINYEFLTGVASYTDKIQYGNRVYAMCTGKKPSVYTRVSYYLDWIKAKTGIEADMSSLSEFCTDLFLGLIKNATYQQILICYRVIKHV